MSILFLSDKQTAQRYCVSRGTIWRWIKKQDFPKPVSLSPGCTRWPVDHLERWEAKRTGQDGEFNHA